MIINPKPLPKNELKLYAIAYLDLLGTSSKIESDKTEEYFFRIHTLYNLAVTYNEDERLSKFPYSKIKTKIFSDNIIMAIPLSSVNDNNGIRCLLEFVSVFQNYSDVLYSWLVRGGITVGNLFLDKVFVWGTGLLRAYELENHIAIYPRVVIDRNIPSLIDGNSDFLYQDIDGQFYINFLNFMRYQDADGNDNFLPTIQSSFQNLVREIRTPSGNYAEKPYQKLQWYKNYINRWYRQSHPDTSFLPIDESFFRQD